MGINEEKQEINVVRDSSESQKFTVAIIILIVYLAFIAFMLFKSEAEDLSWSRMLYLFSGIEAIVFAALGYVFGKDIHRIRAEKAEENVDEAKKETDKAKKETENAKKEADDAKKTAEEEKLKGVQLSTAILARNNSIPNDNSGVVNEAFAVNAKARDNFGEDYLVSLAKSLYEKPDVAKSVSFEYEFSSTDELVEIKIGTFISSSTEGVCPDVALLNGDHFSITVKTSGFANWTFKIKNALDSKGVKRKLVGGELVSNGTNEFVRLEN